MRTTFIQSEAIQVNIKFLAKKDLKNMRFNLSLKDTSGAIAFVTSSYELTKSGIKQGKQHLKLEIPSFLLNKKRYILTVNAGIPDVRILLAPIDVLFIDIEGDKASGSTHNEKWPGIVCPKIEWKLK